ncbi:uncharacterized protein [Littorina saxatilis]|uniref:uncharacterized protein isoform X2 n=1 Tax=Littorina saxatilis TaxID=31220 RepID=UPI0038B6839B
MAVRSVFTRFLFASIVLTFALTSAHAVKITCSILLSDSDNVTVRCTFPFELTSGKKSFGLLHRDTDESAVMCNVIGKGVYCDGPDGITKPNFASNTANFSVPKDAQFTYYCGTTRQDVTISKNCSSEMGTPQVTKSPIPSTTPTLDEKSKVTGWRTWHIALCVTGAVITIAVFIVVIIIILRLRNRRSRPRGPYDHPDGQPPWCTCMHCREMPEECEKICCRQKECLSTTKLFKAHVLDTAEAWEPTEDELLHYGDLMEAKRKYAYTRFIHWKFELVQPGVKIPIYSCCVWAVRTTFPDKQGKYTGFVKGPLIAFETDQLLERL